MQSILQRNIYIFLILPPLQFFFFFFNDTATTEIYTLSLHDALPISIYSTLEKLFMIHDLSNIVFKGYFEGNVISSPRSEVYIFSTLHAQHVCQPYPS